MRLLALIVLLSVSRLGAATGDIVSVAINDNGWSADIAIEGYATNGTYVWGFGTNNSLTSTQSVVFTVWTPGFDDTGTSNWTSQTIYGTKRVRYAYPYDTNAVEIVGGGNLTNRIALSDFVHSSDGNITADIRANWYSNNAAATGVSVANNSVMPYGISIANWTWPGWQRATGSTMTLRAVGFHSSGQQGRPLRVMRFVAQGATSGVYATNFVTQMTLDPHFGDALPFGEYVGTLDISGMTQGENIRCDFTAYPWRGDSAAVMDTLDNRYSLPTPHYASHTNLCDKDQTYGYTYALVATNGSDATGVAMTNFPVNIGSPPAAFATMNGALLAIKGTNNALLGHNDVGGGTVYLSEGTNWTWLGGSGSYNTKPQTWCTVTRWPTNTIDQVILTTQSGNKQIADRTIVRGVTIMLTNAAGGISGDEAVWVDQCVIDSTNGVAIYNNDLWYTTRCRVVALKNGIKPYAAAIMMPVLARGNWITNTDAIMHVLVGNHFRDLNNTKILVNIVGTATPPSFAGICYNNRIENSTLGMSINIGQSSDITNGFALIQNTLEAVSGTSSPVLNLNTATTAYQSTNVLLWNNVLIGDRCNVGYNDSGSSNPYRVLWSLRNNFFDDWNQKRDENVSPYNAARTNCWSVTWGVGFKGNWFNETTGVGVGGAGNFTNEFTGILGYNPASTTSSNAPAHVGRYSGDYRVQSSSPMVNYTDNWLIPWDVAGNRRGNSDPPGAYSVSTPRKGGFF